MINSFELTKLRKYAKENGFKVIARESKDNNGDFCIFIYKPRESHYSIGFNGNLYEKEFHLHRCIRQAYRYIKSNK